MFADILPEHAMFKMNGASRRGPHVCLALPQLSSGGAYVQDERYIAIEHMDVRRDCVNSALQDTLKHIHVSLGLGFLPRTVLAGNTTTPASAAP